MDSQHNVSHLPPAYGTVRRVTRPDAGVASGLTKKPFVAKGHDAQLMEAQQDRLPVRIMLMSGAAFEGTLVKRDRYTLTLSLPGGDEMFFKHAIESVRITRNKA